MAHHQRHVKVIVVMQALQIFVGARTEAETAEGCKIKKLFLYGGGFDPVRTCSTEPPGRTRAGRAFPSCCRWAVQSWTCGAASCRKCWRGL